ncbi:hypothetical protein DL764_000439 [Monosporascus ibericus]|uniref:BT-1020-like N-terminal beta-propeller domain-containing protein n=1 Tax=Monosporascus ibericus TaxID=155417 RepID=A0A4Q4TX06_9PEZI|nr:hypothetical protein DL764_000439 [Monosporascus ibericus]
MTIRALYLAALSTSALYGAQAGTPPPPLAPGEYWQVSPPINYSDPIYAGWPQLKVDKEVVVYRGTDVGRTYAHHPELYYDGHRVYLQYSSAPIDEDSTGQESWLTTSVDGGYTWSPSVSILPEALLPNQTTAANYSYWCDHRIYQRAVHPIAFVPVSRDTLYAVSQTTLRYCWGDDAKGTKAAGRIARAIDEEGNPVGDPCWSSQNEWAYEVRYNETVYGTEYGMKMCEHAEQIEAYLREPATTPAWGSWLYATKLYAADDTHDMQEPTRAVWFGDDEGGCKKHRGGHWERFWRDISGSDTISHAVWVEHTASRSGDDWYPKVEQQRGNAIYRTNIPCVGSKQHLGLLPGGDRFLVHNPRNNTERLRQPLTIATSRGRSRAYTGIGVLKTDANTTIAPDTRGIKRLMFSYPTAVVVEGKLVVSYSENKENIWVSIVDPANLL